MKIEAKKTYDNLCHLKSVGMCLSPQNDCDGRLSNDHFLPRALARRLKLLNKGHLVPDGVPELVYDVINNKANQFRLCRNHHEDVDIRKMAALITNTKLPITDNPAGIFQFFLHGNGYPITEDSRFRDLQISLMRKTTQDFITLVGMFADDLPIPLRRRFKVAQDLGSDYDYKLSILGGEKIYLVA
jgi:hypothetical protein